MLDMYSERIKEAQNSYDMWRFIAYRVQNDSIEEVLAKALTEVEDG